MSTFASWGSADAPNPVPPHVAEVAVGEHYFGDLQESRWWGQDILDGRSPYRYINIYPPTAMWVMVPFGLMSLAPAIVAFGMLSTAALLIPAWLLLRGLRYSHRVLVVVLVGAASAPLLATIDRGNLQGLTVGLIGMSLVALQRSRVRWACVLLALAICVKPFVVVLVLVAIARRRRTFATNTIALALVTTTIAWLALPGSRIDNLGNIILSQFTATSGPSFAFTERIWANVSLHGLVANLDFASSSAVGVRVAFAQSTVAGAAISIAWIGLVFIVAQRRRLPQWLWGSLALASLQLAQPYAAIYSGSWATLAAVWFGLGSVIAPRLAGPDNESVDGWVTSLRVLMIAALAVTLLPLALRPQVGDVVIPVQQILSPALLLVAGIVALVASFARAAPAGLGAAAPAGPGPGEGIRDAPPGQGELQAGTREQGSPR